MPSERGQSTDEIRVIEPGLNDPWSTAPQQSSQVTQRHGIRHATPQTQALHGHAGSEYVFGDRTRFHQRYHPIVEARRAHAPDELGEHGFRTARIEASNHMHDAKPLNHVGQPPGPQC